MQKPADFRTAVFDLKKILMHISTGAGTPDFNPELKESMEAVYGFYMYPEDYAESAHHAEYRQIIKDRIQAKIDEFTTIKPAEQFQYVKTQTRRHRKAKRHQAHAAKNVSKRPDRPGVEPEDEMTARIFGGAAPSPGLFQAIIDRTPMQALITLVYDNRENPIRQREILQTVVESLPDYLSDTYELLMMWEFIHSDNHPIIIEALGGCTGIVDKYLKCDERTHRLGSGRALRDVFYIMPQHLAEIITQIRDRIDFIFPQSDTVFGAGFTEVFGVNAQPEWRVELCEGLGVETVARLLAQHYASNSIHTIDNSLEGLVKLPSAMITGVIAALPDALKEEHYGCHPPDFYPYLLHIVRHVIGLDSQEAWSTASIRAYMRMMRMTALFKGLGGNVVQKIIDTCVDESDKNKLREMAEMAGIELRSSRPGMRL